jgi:hypothetical protein
MEIHTESYNAAIHEAKELVSAIESVKGSALTEAKHLLIFQLNNLLK